MKILSHGINEQGLKQIAASTRERLLSGGARSGASVEEQLAALEGLLGCELGQFMLEHKGLNGFWTEYVCSYPARKARGETTGYSPAEVELLEGLPVCTATQERYTIFRTEIRKRLADRSVCASLPCGLMTEFLLMPPELTSHCRFVGIDLDPESISQAKALALTRGLLHRTEFRVQDAWSLPPVEEFDLLTSNGLNIYVQEDKAVEDLYKRFHAVLKPGGVLVTSMISPRPEVDPDSSWKQEAIDQERLRRQALLFIEVMQVSFLHPRSPRKTQAQLEAAGFRSVEFIHDSQGLFPTVIAIK